MNKTIFFILPILAQLTICTTIIIPPLSLANFSNVKASITNPSANPFSFADSLPTNTLPTLIKSSIKAQEGQVNGTGSSKQKPNKYYMGLIIPSQRENTQTQNNQGDEPSSIGTKDKPNEISTSPKISENTEQNSSSNNSNVIANPILIAQPDPALVSPQQNPILSQEILDFVYEPKKLTPKSVIYANISKDANYSLSFNLVIAGSSKIDKNAKITATIQANKNVTNIKVSQGISKQAIIFYGTKGNDEISVILNVEGKCKGFIYALLTNMQVVQLK